MNAHGCIGWRGVIYVELFAIFEIGHIAVDQIYFEEFNSKKSASLAVRMHCAHATKFFDFINHRDLKNQG